MSSNSYFRQLNHRRIDAGRAFKLNLVQWLFERFSKLATRSESAGILVLRLDDKLGDSVTATGFLKALKQENPTSKLSVVCGPSTASLYRNLQFIDEVFISKKGLLATFQLKRKLQKQPYKFIINTSHILNPRVVFLVSTLPAYRKVGFENFQSSIFSDHVKLDFQKDHVTDRYLKILKTLNTATTVSSIDYVFTPSSVALFKANELMLKLRTRTPYIVALNSFAGGNLRNLREHATLQIIEKLLKDSEICVLSLASAGDQRVLRNWHNRFGSDRWVISSELSSLEENIALMSLSDVIVTPDTAWVHLASALKANLVAIYREDLPTFEEQNAVIWAPYKTKFTKVIVPLSAGSKEADIATVNTDEVVAATLKMLGRQ